MPIGYLVTVAVVAWCTVFALAPPRPRQSSTTNLSYWFGYMLNEQPFLGCYWLLAATALAFAEGDVTSPVGWLAFGLAVLTAIGLAIIAWRALLTGPVLDRALGARLGAGWRTAIDAGMAARLRRRLPLARILFAPFFVRRRDVERVANIRYGDAGKYNRLDVYRHRSHPAGAPVLIHLHGGAFRIGGKSREARALLYRFASQGWVCISANYRLSPAAAFPDHHIDAKKVIAWVREHGREYGADPSTVFVSGSSAGAHMAAFAALTPNVPAFQPGFEHVDTSITAAICLYGYYGDLDSDSPFPSSPQAYVRADAPPFFVVHGDLDTLVIVKDARAFVERLRSVSSGAVVYAELPGAQHTFDLLHSLRFDTVVAAIEAFAAWVRSRDEAPAAGAPARPVGNRSAVGGS